MPFTTLTDLFGTTTERPESEETAPMIVPRATAGGTGTQRPEDLEAGHCGQLPEVEPKSRWVGLVSSPAALVLLALAFVGLMGGVVFYVNHHRAHVSDTVAGGTHFGPPALPSPPQKAPVPNLPPPATKQEPKSAPTSPGASESKEVASYQVPTVPSSLLLPAAAFSQLFAASPAELEKMLGVFDKVKGNVFVPHLVHALEANTDSILTAADALDFNDEKKAKAVSEVFEKHSHIINFIASDKKLEAWAESLFQRIVAQHTGRVKGKGELPAFLQVSTGTFIKSLGNGFVGFSRVCAGAFVALLSLPIMITAPLMALSPIWMLLGTLGVPVDPSLTWGGSFLNLGISPFVWSFGFGMFKGGVSEMKEGAAQFQEGAAQLKSAVGGHGPSGPRVPGLPFPVPVVGPGPNKLP